VTDFPLYQSEAQIARKVLGANRLDEWRGLAVILERAGLPRIDPMFGGRFWPAVKAWFKKRNGVDIVAPGRVMTQDGVETCPEPRRARRVSSGAGGATVHQLPTGLRAQTS
jgi:hypothetical protein